MTSARNTTKMSCNLTGYFCIYVSGSSLLLFPQCRLDTTTFLLLHIMIKRSISSRRSPRYSIPYSTTCRYVRYTLIESILYLHGTDFGRGEHQTNYSVFRSKTRTLDEPRPHRHHRQPPNWLHMLVWLTTP